MSKLSFNELAKQAVQKSLSARAVGDREISVKEFEEARAILNSMLCTDGSYRGPKLSMAEALRTADASILFPKVISDVLLRPKEPLMLGQSLLARTVQVDNVRSVEFPTMGAIRAFDMSDTQEYREQLPGFTEHFTEVKVNKVGLMISLTEDIIRDSMWDVMALFLESAGYAMLRHKEEKIFKEFQDKAHVVFDNSLTTPDAWTGGRGQNQTRNYSVTFDDFIDAMGALVSHEYVPTDFILHPLAWSIFMKDPVIRNVMYTGGQLGASVYRQAPQFDQQVNTPWNVSYQVSPFVPMSLNATLSTGPASGLAATNVTDIFVIDRNHTCVILERDGMETEQFADPIRDITSVKIRERYGVGVLNGGRSAARIANVRLEQNWAPIQAMYQVTPS